jgi:hypothetical protein
MPGVMCLSLPYIEMKDNIDWKAIAVQLGTLSAGGESSGSHQARQAIELLLGEDNLRKSVDYYISGGQGSELARSVLWLLRPWSAMSYCYEIYQSDRDVETRRMAVELLRVVADERALGWVAEFLEDEDAGIQTWGVEMLEQLISSGSVDGEDAEQQLLKAEAHANIHVRERAALIRENLNRAEVYWAAQRGV